MLFMLFFLLRDWPYSVGVSDAPHYNGAAVQGQAVCLRGDVRRAVVFEVIGTIAALLPVGSAVVLVQAVLYLAFSGRWAMAIFLGVWSVGVGLVDDVLRPFLASQCAEVLMLVVFVGAIGGVSAVGILGLVVGPVLLSLPIALVRFAGLARTAPAD